jgi:hypothetical protein
MTLQPIRRPTVASTNELRFTFSDEEVEFIRAKPRGFVRRLVQECMQPHADGTGSVEWVVYLTAEESEYVRGRRLTDKAAWFSKVARINMEARASGKTPFYWLSPEGEEDL